MKSHEKDKLIEELSMNLKKKISELLYEKENVKKLKLKVEEFKEQNSKNV